MSKNDPIFCFNTAECIYIRCGMYDDTTSICGIERLKTTTIKEAAKPSQVQAAQGRVEATSRQKIASANEKPFTNCKDVAYGMKGFKIHGKVLDDPMKQELKTKKGPMEVIKFRVDDGTSQIRLTFWNISKVPVLKSGDEITVEGLMGSEPYDGLPQASGGPYVKITFEKV
jgi:hypothetical protein